MKIRNTVSAVITNEEHKILFEDHIKCNGFTLPGGKVEESDISLTEALMRELHEELGITVTEGSCIHLFSNFFQDVEYPVGSGNKITYMSHVYIISEYYGDITNMEPDKHRDVKFLSLPELQNLNRTNITDSLIHYMQTKEKVLSGEETNKTIEESVEEVKPETTSESE